MEQTAQKTPQVVIVGGGLAGLACARELWLNKVPFRLFEAADQVGGRVRTDVEEGFLLDRGFQVLLPAYPEAQRVLDYDALDLRRFYPGARVVLGKGSRLLADPLRHPLDAVKSLAGGLGFWGDFWRVLLLRKDCAGLRGLRRGAGEMETSHYLQRLGFSAAWIDQFFRPFFGGIFLEKDLRTSSAVFRYLFAMFAQGGAAVPAKGMQEIPRQLAARLPQKSVVCGKTACSVADGEVTFDDGEVVKAAQVVLATSQSAAEKLLPESLRSPSPPRVRSVMCMYFAAHRQPATERVIWLDGEGRGPVNNACVLSNVSSHYAPAGLHLISATILGMPEGPNLQDEVRRQMTRWFGRQAADWRHLRTCRIRDAQPEEAQLPGALRQAPPRVSPQIVRAGDYCADASINGALLSGRRAAEEVLRSLGRA